MTYQGEVDESTKALGTGEPTFGWLIVKVASFLSASTQLAL